MSHKSERDREIFFKTKFLDLHGDSFKSSRVFCIWVSHKSEEEGNNILSEFLELFHGDFLISLYY